MSDKSNIWNSSPTASRNGNNLPPPLSLNSFRADANVFTPKTASEVFYSINPQSSHTTTASGKEPLSPFYPMETAPFIPPDTPAPEEDKFVESRIAKGSMSDSRGSANQVSPDSLLGSYASVGHRGDGLQGSESQTPATAATGTTNQKSHSGTLYGTGGPGKVSASASGSVSKSSSSRTSPSQAEIVSPSPQRRYSLQSNVERKDLEENGGSLSDVPAFVGSSNFIGAQTIVEEPENISSIRDAATLDVRKRTQPLPTTQQRNTPSVDLFDRGATPGGVMLPRGSEFSAAGSWHGAHASKGKESSDVLRDGLNKVQITSRAESSLYRPPHLAQLSRNGSNSSRFPGFAESRHLGSSSPESTYSTESIETRSPGGLVDSAIATQSLYNDQQLTQSQNPKALARFIMAGGLDDESGTISKGVKSHNPSRSQTPRSGGIRQQYQAPPHVIYDQPPQQPDMATQEFMMKAFPTFNEVLLFVPFVELCKTVGPVSFGVLEVTDIPYNTKRNEIVAFLGRNAKIANQPQGTAYFAIHIIMERQTAKSMDCFVEYETPGDAEFASTRYPLGGRRPRIGDRCVKVNLSSQEALMSQLFPRTKCVKWQGQEPIISNPEDRHSSGFQGFTAGEELVMTAKYAENPNRSRFAIKHPQRAYESMISLLSKYPWWRTDSITLGERDNIFRATRDCVKAFVDALHRGTYPDVLTPYLLQELLTVALNAPGFSEKQRAEMAYFASSIIQFPPAHVSAVASSWPFEVLRKKPDASEQLVQYYSQILQASAGQVMPNPYAPPPPFGNFSVVYPNDQAKAAMTLDQAAALEWQAVQTAIGAFFPGEGVGY